MSQKGLSYTAWLVMTCQLALRDDPRWQALVPDESAAFYARAHDYCRRHSRFFRSISLMPPRQHAWILDKSLARGAVQHYALRKRAIRAHAEECIRFGAGQVVVLGGGFDVLTLSLAQQYPAVTCIEIDLPPMQAHKYVIVQEHLRPLPSNYHSLGGDLAKIPLDELLAGFPAFHGDKPTLIILEGVSMYLNASQIDRLFESIRRACTGKTSVLFTAVEQHEKTTNRFTSLFCKSLLALSSERMSWSMERKRMPDFLRAAGFVQRDLQSYADLQRPWRTAQEMPEFEKQRNSEYLVYAQKG